MQGVNLKRFTDTESLNIRVLMPNNTFEIFDAIKLLWFALFFSFSSVGADNTSDTESAPSPSQSDTSKPTESQTQTLDQEAAAPKVPNADTKAQEPFNELQVKLEKSPEGAVVDESMVKDEAQLHPKSEPQDTETAGGDRAEVQVKTEPELREKEKQSEQPHSDNDSSATCSADEDIDAEPDRQRWDSGTVSVLCHSYTIL